MQRKKQRITQEDHCWVQKHFLLGPNVLTRLSLSNLFFFFLLIWPNLYSSDSFGCNFGGNSFCTLFSSTLVNKRFNEKKEEEEEEEMYIYFLRARNVIECTVIDMYRIENCTLLLFSSSFLLCPTKNNVNQPIIFSHNGASEG